jgi:hypothetical protein
MIAGLICGDKTPHTLWRAQCNYRLFWRWKLFIGSTEWIFLFHIILRINWINSLKKFNWLVSWGRNWIFRYFFRLTSSFKTIKICDSGFVPEINYRSWKLITRTLRGFNLIDTECCVAAKRNLFCGWDFQSRANDIDTCNFNASCNI